MKCVKLEMTGRQVKILYVSYVAQEASTVQYGLGMVPIRILSYIHCLQFMNDCLKRLLKLHVQSLRNLFDGFKTNLITQTYFKLSL